MSDDTSISQRPVEDLHLLSSAILPDSINQQNSYRGYGFRKLQKFRLGNEDP